VWEETSTNLRRGGGGGEGADAGLKLPDVSELPASATWKLPGDLGRRYGAVSGDMNPIHVHPLSARLFGFPSAIAHGMWTKARCLAALGSELPDAFTAQVAFRKPIMLPATVTFAERAREGGIDFGVRHARKDTPHLDGAISF
jgi:acyl dehydratase